MRVSPRKLNLVAGLIRNLPAQQAVATLTFSKRRIAQQVRRRWRARLPMLRTTISSTSIDWWCRAPKSGRSVVMRRFHARGRGRAARVEKWFSHLKIVVAERAQEVEQEGGAA